MRKLGKICLKRVYIDKIEFQNWIKRIFALAMTPINKVESILRNFLENTPEMPQTDEFWDNIVNT